MKLKKAFEKAQVLVIEQALKIQGTALGAALLLSPSVACAASITEDITGLFKNTGTLVWTAYEGIVLIIGGVCLLSIGKELLPAVLDARLRESPEFKNHCRNAVISVVVVLAFALAPLWAPNLLEFFAGSNTISFSSGSK